VYIRQHTFVNVNCRQNTWDAHYAQHV